MSLSRQCERVECRVSIAARACRLRRLTLQNRYVGITAAQATDE